MGKRSPKAIYNSLKNIQSWHVVLEGEAEGVWSGVKPLKALGLVRDSSMPPSTKAESLTQALTIWFQKRKAPPIVGVGRDLILRPGTEEYTALSPFFKEIHKTLYKGKEGETPRAPLYLVRTDGSYSDRQTAMGFAVVAYARSGDGEGGYKEVGRVQGGNVGWGDSRVAEYGAIAIGLTLVPAGASVLVESDLEELVQALRGKRVPKGEVGAYFAVIQATIRAKGLTVRARKASRGGVETAHALANGGRKELAQTGPLMDLLRMVKVGGRALVFEALRALPSPEAEIPETERTWKADRLRYLRAQAPDLFAKAWQEARRMKDREAKAFAEELLLASMRGKPPTEEQVRLLLNLGREVPKDRAEAYQLIRQVKGALR